MSKMLCVHVHINNIVTRRVLVIPIGKSTWDPDYSSSNCSRSHLCYTQVGILFKTSFVISSESELLDSCCSSTRNTPMPQWKIPMCNIQSVLDAFQAKLPNSSQAYTAPKFENKVPKWLNESILLPWKSNIYAKCAFVWIFRQFVLQLMFLVHTS